jgi:hypothetical protein
LEKGKGGVGDRKDIKEGRKGGKEMKGKEVWDRSGGSRVGRKKRREEEKKEGRKEEKEGTKEGTRKTKGKKEERKEGGLRSHITGLSPSFLLSSTFLPYFCHLPSFLPSAIYLPSFCHLSSSLLPPFFFPSVIFLLSFCCLLSFRPSVRPSVLSFFPSFLLLSSFLPFFLFSFNYLHRPSSEKKDGRRIGRISRKEGRLEKGRVGGISRISRKEGSKKSRKERW